jgi:hypothetical protein
MNFVDSLGFPTGASSINDLLLSDDGKYLLIAADNDLYSFDFEANTYTRAGKNLECKEIVSDKSDQVDKYYAAFFESTATGDRIYLGVFQPDTLSPDNGITIYQGDINLYFGGMDAYDNELLLSYQIEFPSLNFQSNLFSIHNMSSFSTVKVISNPEDQELSNVKWSIPWDRFVCVDGTRILTIRYYNGSWGEEDYRETQSNANRVDPINAYENGYLQTWAFIAQEIYSAGAQITYDDVFYDTPQSWKDTAAVPNTDYPKIFFVATGSGGAWKLYTYSGYLPPENNYTGLNADVITFGPSVD